MEKFLNRKKNLFILVSLIILLGSILRLWQLGAVPPSPDWDEAALGYNAYSIAETGRDEFGKFMPIVLRSFDDYKPALYAYLIIPTYKIFSLNTFSVRLPSAIFGILTIFAVYLLIKQLFKRNDIALLTALMLAISPWHIQFSRIAFESNVGLALNIFAVTFFLYALKRPWLLILSAISAGLSLYAYQSEKVFTPIFMLGICIIFGGQFLKLPKKYLALFVLTGVIVVLPMILYIFTDSQALLRAKGTSIFNDKTVVLKENAQRNIFNLETGNKLGKIFDNRRIEYTKTIIDGYLSHFNPNWLLNGDIARHHAPDMGLIYIWEFPLILIGIYTLIFSKFSKKTKMLVFFWFLLSPVPASITTGVPHAVRTLNFLPTWQLFTALGVIGFFSYVKKNDLRFRNYDLSRLFYFLCIASFVFIVFFNFVYYLNQYFVQQNYFHASEWQYGYEKMVNEVKNRQDSYDKIIISDKQPMDKSYMFFLFYLKYSPEKYQTFKQESGGFAQHQKFDKYEFRPIVKGEDSTVFKALYVGLPEEFSPKANILYKVEYPDGKPAMVMVRN